VSHHALRRGITLAAVAATAVAAAAVPASAKQPGNLGGLHNARYCEIIELRGTLPHAHATVWNTIGLNTCPPAWWAGFNAAALAHARDDTAVKLNGPRRFLMDSVLHARTGRTERFHGRRLRRVASLPIRTAADAVQTPYVDRTVDRSNAWHWRAGRRIYELVAPGGDVYVMQAYSQIVDPSLRLSDLTALGRRLELPPGWRYRSRVLKRPLTLNSPGHTTIMQDELEDTYQLAQATRSGKRAAHDVSLTASTRNVDSGPGGTVEDKGTVTGRPFGAGQVDITGTLADGLLDGAFRMTFPRGEVRGSVHMAFTISGTQITFRGRSRITGGTGAFRGIRGHGLDTTDTNTLDGQNGKVAVEGSVRY
jgi:hypothetical protein